MNIGLYFGTFNPIHTAHVTIARYMAEKTDLDQVWLVVTPLNPLKSADDIMPDTVRYEMVGLAIAHEGTRLRPSDEEFNLPKPSYTWQSLRHFSHKFPQHRFVLIMGEDNLRVFDQWRDHDEIIANYQIYVYPRSGGIAADEPAYSSEKLSRDRVKLFDVPVIPVSATQIRDLIRAGKDTTGLLNPDVRKLIDKKGYFSESGSGQTKD